MTESKHRIMRVVFAKESGYSELVKTVEEEKESGVESSQNSKLYKSVQTAVEKLKINPSCGAHIKKAFWPPEIIDKYGIANLWKLNLYGNWRMLYTITGDNIEIVSFVLQIIDHKKYDKLFGYSGKKRGS